MKALWILAGLALLGGFASQAPAADTQESPCAVCRVWDGTMAGVPEAALDLDARPVQNGVVLRATSTDAGTQRALWQVSAERQELLEQLRRGNAIPLCADCRANVTAFETLRIDMRRLPDGVLLLYTSTDPQVVRRLHALIAAPAHPL